MQRGTYEASEGADKRTGTAAVIQTKGADASGANEEAPEARLFRKVQGSGDGMLCEGR